MNQFLGEQILKLQFLSPDCCSAVFASFFVFLRPSHIATEYQLWQKLNNLVLDKYKLQLQLCYLLAKLFSTDTTDQKPTYFLNCTSLEEKLENILLYNIQAHRYVCISSEMTLQTFAMWKVEILFTIKITKWNLRNCYKCIFKIYGNSANLLKFNETFYTFCIDNWIYLLKFFLESGDLGWIFYLK